MSLDDRDLGKEFEQSHGGDHERNGELGKSFAAEAADRMAGQLVCSGWMGHHREDMSVDRPPVMTGFEWKHGKADTVRDEITRINDASKVLADEPEGTVVIRETYDDNDYLDGSSKVLWLRCENLEVVKEYLNRVGEEYTYPGPGEGDDQRYLRKIFVKEGPDQVTPVWTGHPALKPHDQAIL